MRGNQYQTNSNPNYQNQYDKIKQQRNKQSNKKNKSDSTINNLQKYASKKKSATKDTVNQHNKSNIRKFTMYLNDTTNVFYEERQQIKKFKIYQMISPLMNKILFFLVLNWLILYFVKPFQGVCPKHADCGVYIHCHPGFVLKNNDCEISQQTKSTANSICESVVKNLKLQYGNQDCSKQSSRLFPLKTIHNIYKDYQVNNKALENQIFIWFTTLQKQQNFAFNFKNNQITPRVKQFSLSCRFQKMVEAQYFYWYFTAFIIAILSLLVFLRIKSEKRRAEKIFEYLKNKTTKQHQITILIQQLQSLFGNIYPALWQDVQKLRILDKSMVFYQDENVHWKLV